MKHGSLFSGIGGFDLAAEWMGWENVFHCEWNEFGQKVLKYYWPNAISYGDITKTDFSIHRGNIDILTGGFPCQPFSVAGKQKGTSDDRYLWPEMLRAIREIQPRFIVGENVPGLVNWSGGLVFQRVQVDLENEGYEVWPVEIPVAGIGGKQRRERIWFIANLHKVSGESMGERHAKDSQQRSSEFGSKDRELLHMVVDGISPAEWWHKEYPVISEPALICDTHGIPETLDGITFSKWCNESNAAFGNSVSPGVVYQIFKAIEATA